MLAGEMERLGHSALRRFAEMLRIPELLLFSIGLVVLLIRWQVESDNPAVKPDPIVKYSTVIVGLALIIAGMVLTFRRSEQREPLALTAQDVASGDLELAVKQLGANYDLLRRQVSQGFAFAGLAMVAGVFVVLAGAFGNLFGLTATRDGTTLVVGAVVEVVSALGFYLFKNTFDRLNVTSDRLHDTWKLLAAFKKAESLPEEKRTEVTVRLIEQLVG